MLIRVDLPQPDLPIIATNSPAVYGQVDAFERGEIARTALVGLDDLAHVDESVGRWGGVETAVCRWYLSKFGKHSLYCS